MSECNVSTVHGADPQGAPTNPAEAGGTVDGAVLAGVAAEAISLAADGFAVCRILPGQKRPTTPGWTTRSAEAGEFQAGDGLGILTGPLSDGGVPGVSLVVVDLDSAGAVAAADDFLPPTGMIDGRPGKLRSRRFYLVRTGSIPLWARSTAPLALKAALDAVGHPGPRTVVFRNLHGVQFELRGTGGRVVAPPSPHPSGELREWHGGARGTPPELDFDTLWAAVAALAGRLGCRVPGAVATDSGLNHAAPGVDPEAATDGSDDRLAAWYALYQAAEAGDDVVVGDQRFTLLQRFTRAAAELKGIPDDDLPRSGHGGHDAFHRRVRRWANDFLVRGEDELLGLCEQLNMRLGDAADRIPLQAAEFEPWSADEVRDTVEDALNAAPDAAYPPGRALVPAGAQEPVVRNYDQGHDPDKGKPAHLSRHANRITADILAAFGDNVFLKVKGKLYGRIDGRLEPFDSAKQFFGYLQYSLGTGERSPVDWRQGPGLLAKEEFLDSFGRSPALPSYSDATLRPHHPPVPDMLYMGPPVEPCGGPLLDQLLDRFCPATRHDRALLKALLLTPFWGGPGGARPAFMLRAEEDDLGGGVGVGKSSVAEILAELAGSPVHLSDKVDYQRFISDLLSPASWDKRLIVWDNIKRSKIDMSDLEGFLTAETLSGHLLYKGWAEIANRFTMIFTANGGGLSKDLAQRVVVVHLRRPAEQSATWKSDTKDFIRANKHQLFGEIAGLLQKAEGADYGKQSWSRWAPWEKAVLGGCAADGAELEATLRCVKERQAIEDVDARESGDLVERIRELLDERAVAAETAVYEIPKADVLRIARDHLNLPHGPDKPVMVKFGRAIRGAAEVAGVRRASGNTYFWVGKQFAGREALIEAGGYEAYRQAARASLGEV